MDTAIQDEFVNFVETTRAGAVVLEVIFDRPAKLNSVPTASLESITSYLEAIEPDDAATVLFRGVEDDFCAGVDVAELSVSEEDDPSESATTIHALVDAIRMCPLPVVAQVSGRAYGAGFLVCMAADIVIAAENAEFGLQEINLGIPVAGYASTILPQIVGEHHARDWLFTGRSIPASQAEQTGFAVRTAPVEEITTAVDEYLQHLGSSSSTAIELLKHRMNDLSGSDVEEIQEIEKDHIRIAFTDGDASDRIEEFLEES